ncbi:MAG: hypothetical protein RL095_1213 [Verrucomicrobiota bacterium]|jgi:hypothetical protein
MHRLLLLLFLTFGCAAAPIPRNLLTEKSAWVLRCAPSDAAKPGFVFTPEGTWILDTQGRKDHGYLFLEHQEEFGDFDAELRFRADASRSGNSGLQFRSRWNPADGKAGWMNGPQIDIHPPGPWRIGFLYDETRGAQRWICPSRKNWVLEEQPRAPGWVFHDAAKDPSACNTLRLVCRGTRIQTWLNGAPVSDYEGKGILDDEAHAKAGTGLRGRFALQIHADDDVKLEFISLKLLPPTP